MKRTNAEFLAIFGGGGGCVLCLLLCAWHGDHKGRE